MDLPKLEELEVLADILPTFLRKNERVLLCFPGKEEPVGEVAARSVERFGGIPVFWGEDLLWKTLLRKGFQERCSTIIGPPSIILGLSKLAARAATPLYIRNAVVLGDLPDAWMTKSIQDSLDCVIRCWIPGRGERRTDDEKVCQLKRELRRWTTILDFKIENLGPGLSLELITFPGEKLPKFPSFGRMVVRDWNSDEDVPFDIPLQWKTGIFSSKNH